MESCDKHDDAVVVYATRGYRTQCPVCKLQDELDTATHDLESMKDERDDASRYADELADELAQYNQPVPERNRTGRKFR